ncbi:hypothetical protein M5J14_18560 [Lysinibacillus sp. OL1_EC]|uniref:hypothetical protein n=1 Tax=unclassified Lysinibacillus TaxID=2636778 RepID=UPI00103A71A0|nr:MULTISPECIES: hypothetical protein [unclassified Lysinibacillus]MCM0626501.1 hypothetical protein [Lysinibacillus sp. OL1_EC]TBV85638.1 hypothetical protein EW028_19625 [Lysinibacillus sp. OL1]
MNEQFLIGQIILYLGQYQRFGGKQNEIMAYKRLDQLRALVGLKDADEATDYLIMKMEGAMAA